MNIPELNPSHKTKEGKTFKVINIIAMLIFIFNMTALQGLMLALPVQASVVNGSPIAIDNGEVGNQQENLDLTLTKTITSSNLVHGGSIVYELAYENTGNVNLTNVQIVDDYPQQYVTVTDDGGAVDNGDTLTWPTISVLPVGGSGTVTYTVTINSNTPELTDIENIATADSDQTGPVDDNAITQIPEMPVDQPGPPEQVPTIDLVKSVSTDTVVAGDNLTYSLDWSIAGNADATDVTITDILPQNTTFVSADNGGVYDSNVNTVIWNLGTKSPGDSGTVSMTVTTDEFLPEGATITNTGVMDCNETGPVTDDALTNVTVASPNAPILQITKDVNVDTANPGDTATYTVVVTNVGGDAAINTVLDDVLPSGLTYVDGGGTTKTFTLGDIVVGDSVTQTYDVTIDASVGAGTYTNTATAQADNHHPVSDDADVVVQLPVVLGEETNPELGITKEVNADFANPGEAVEYIVNVTNTGDGDAINVVLTDQLPAGFTFIDTTDAVKTWELRDLVPENTKTITYSVRIADTVTAGTYENLAIVNADNADEKQAKAPLEVRAPAVLGALEETGTSLLDYLYYLLGFGILTLGLSFYLKKARKAEKVK